MGVYEWTQGNAKAKKRSELSMQAERAGMRLDATCSSIHDPTAIRY